MSPQNKTRSKSPKGKSPKRKTRKSRVSYGFNQPLQRENRRMSRKHTKGRSKEHQRYEERNGPQRNANTYGTLRPIQNNENARLLEERKELNARNMVGHFMKQYGNAEPIYRELKRRRVGRRLGGSFSKLSPLKQFQELARRSKTVNPVNYPFLDSPKEQNDAQQEQTYEEKIKDIEYRKKQTEKNETKVRLETLQFENSSEAFYETIKKTKGNFMENIIRVSETAIVEKHTHILILLVISMIHFIVEKMNELELGQKDDVDNVDLRETAFIALTDKDNQYFKENLQKIQILLQSNEPPTQDIYNECYNLLIRMKDKLGGIKNGE